MVFRKGVDIHLVVGDGHLKGLMRDCVRGMIVNRLKRKESP
jgi:hypothetical protein